MLPLVLAVLLCFTSAAHGASPSARIPATLIKEYTGSHPDVFTAEFDRVRVLAHVAQVEVSSRLGLMQYREGFQYPLTIRFEDGAPPGLESALAYVYLKSSAKGFEQALVINVEALAQNPSDFDTVFYHEMTHAVMNDAVGGEASIRIPHWAQEGLAIYVSGEGDERVKNAAQHFRRSQAGALVMDVDGPYSGYAYPQYYLAIKYFVDAGSTSALQAFVRHLIFGKSAAEAIFESLNMDLPTFKKNLSEYSLKIFQDQALPDF
jgi:hypothetical protein